MDAAAAAAAAASPATTTAAADSYEGRLLALRNSWRFAAAAQFLHLFSGAFGIDDFFTEDLEEALLAPYSDYLTDLAVKMLRVMTQNRFITHDKWSEYLRREFLKRDPHLNPFASQPDDARWLRYHARHSATPLATHPSDPARASPPPSSDHEDHIEPVDSASAPNFWALSDPQRIIAFHRICEWQTDNPERFLKTVQKKGDENMEDWRVVPIGSDRFNRDYWLFDDNRLYRAWPCDQELQAALDRCLRAVQRRRERRATKRAKLKAPDPPPLSDDEDTEPSIEQLLHQRPPHRWELLCRTVAEWDAFYSAFGAQKPRANNEKYLATILKNDIYPVVVPDIQRAEKERKKQHSANLRKRSSRIALKEMEQQQRELQDYRQRQQMGLLSTDELRDRFGDDYDASDGKQDLAMARERRYLERQWRLATSDVQGWGDHDASDDSMVPRRRSRRTTSHTSVYGSSTRAAASLHASTWVRRSERKRKRPAEYIDAPVIHDDEEDEEEEWDFACICGVKGRNVTDGQRMVACDACAVWQHYACVLASDPWVQRHPDWEEKPFYCVRCRPSFEATATATSPQPAIAPSRNGQADTDGDAYHLSDASSTSSTGADHASDASWNQASRDDEAPRLRAMAPTPHSSQSQGDVRMKEAAGIHDTASD